MSVTAPIIIAVTFRIEGDDTHFRQHELVAALRRTMPKLLDRGQIDEKLHHVPEPNTADPRRAGWDDYFVHLSYELKQ